MIPGFEDLRLIGVGELAELCDSGEDWIRQGCAARTIEWTKAGREIKFTRDQARAAIASKAVPVQNPGRSE